MPDFGTSKEKGVRNAKARSIPPKGLPTTGNGSPPSRVNDKPFPLPPSNSSPDMGAARGGTKAPKRRPDKSSKTKSAPMKGQRMRERDSTQRSVKKPRKQ